MNHPNPLLKRVLCLVLVFASDIAFSQTDLWESTKSPYGGHVNSLVINSSGEIFAGTGGGVFRSTDNGMSWQEDILAMPVISNERLFAQGGLESGNTLAKRVIVNASFQYQDIPDVWDINYYGIIGEVYLNDYLSYSGSLYYGKGSENLQYVHFPVAGLLLLLPILYVESRMDSAVMEPLTYLRILMLENIYYSFNTSNKVIISPFVSLLGFDGVVHGGENANSGLAILSSGVGINIKALPTGGLAIGWTLTLKRFFVRNQGNFEKASYNGYTFAINLGYVF